MVLTEQRQYFFLKLFGYNTIGSSHSFKPTDKTTVTTTPLFNHQKIRKITSLLLPLAGFIAILFATNSYQYFKLNPYFAAGG